MAYTAYGYPNWTDGGAPGIAAEFLNPLEAFLLSLNSASYDTHFTSDGSGNLTTTGKMTMTSCNVTTGKITRISTFSGSGAGTFSHGLGAAPTLILFSYSGNFGGPPTHPIYYYSVTSTSCYVQADNGFFWEALAIAL